MCQDLSFINFGTCDQSLGFGVQSGFCGEIFGCKDQSDLFHQPSLFSSMEQCVTECHCQDLSNLEFQVDSYCPQTSGFALSNGKCQKFSACSDFLKGSILAPALHPTAEACEYVCKAHLRSFETFLGKPVGWGMATHGKRDPPEYDQVFPRKPKVQRLDIKFSNSNYKRMEADLKSLIEEHFELEKADLTRMVNDQLRAMGVKVRTLAPTRLSVVPTFTPPTAYTFPPTPARKRPPQQQQGEKEEQQDTQTSSSSFSSSDSSSFVGPQQSDESLSLLPPAPPPVTIPPSPKAPLTCETSKASCENVDTFSCNYWTKDGECSANPDFMLDSCKLSCCPVQCPQQESNEQVEQVEVPEIERMNEQNELEIQQLILGRWLPQQNGVRSDSSTWFQQQLQKQVTDTLAQQQLQQEQLETYLKQLQADEMQWQQQAAAQAQANQQQYLVQQQQQQQQQ
eukprot:CAMPEP_0175163308 /NCGR_PEP_ID=MMETSP0087-20121206/25677_1 /TAXON_ID=136419 /ORGANISM="Unknown Unknown, Strain D1" /LENGTH=452 /DNA_ID=CAMNT_0016451997 /DNA_START=726 /DNA_END=2081 /DNA_ORIENTATION=-